MGPRHGRLQAAKPKPQFTGALTPPPPPQVRNLSQQLTLLRDSAERDRKAAISDRKAAQAERQTAAMMTSANKEFAR